jgi:AraC-like DNA-binding protein
MSQGKMLFDRFLGMVSNNSVKRRPISHYASQLAITPKYLTMLCLKYSDKTASDWIIQYTTEDIRFYLKNSNLSIKEISAKLGFSNMSHFGSYVRKHMGSSPSEYRENKE